MHATGQIWLDKVRTRCQNSERAVKTLCSEFNELKMPAVFSSFVFASTAVNSCRVILPHQQHNNNNTGCFWPWEKFICQTWRNEDRLHQDREINLSATSPCKYHKIEGGWVEKRELLRRKQYTCKCWAGVLRNWSTISQTEIWTFDRGCVACVVFWSGRSSFARH